LFTADDEDLYETWGVDATPVAVEDKILDKKEDKMFVGLDKKVKKKNRKRNAGKR